MVRVRHFKHVFIQHNVKIYGLGIKLCSLWLKLSTTPTPLPTTLWMGKRSISDVYSSLSQQQHKAKRRKLFGAKLTKLFQTFSIMKIKQFAREVFKLGIRRHFVLPQPPNHKVAFREIIQPSKGNAEKEANDFKEFPQ